MEFAYVKPSHRQGNLYCMQGGNMMGGGSYFDICCLRTVSLWGVILRVSFGCLSRCFPSFFTSREAAWSCVSVVTSCSCCLDFYFLVTSFKSFKVPKKWLFSTKNCARWGMVEWIELTLLMLEVQGSNPGHSISNKAKRFAKQQRFNVAFIACVSCYFLRAESNGYQQRKELQRWVVDGSGPL